jgi:hypothetical protein
MSYTKRVSFSDISLVVLKIINTFVHLSINKWFVFISQEYFDLMGKKLH